VIGAFAAAYRRAARARVTASSAAAGRTSALAAATEAAYTFIHRERIIRSILLLFVIIHP